MSEARPWPRMMKRATAAAYCDLSVAELEREVSRGNLPPPVKLGNHEHWSRVAIDDHLGRLSGDVTPNWRNGSKLYAQA